MVGNRIFSAVEVALEDVDEDGFDGDAAVFVAFAADLNSLTWKRLGPGRSAPRAWPTRAILRRPSGLTRM